MSKDLGMALKLLRKNCEFTQQQVADALNMERSTYAYYEGGSTEPDLKTIKKISKIFQIPVEMLLPNSDGSIKVCLNDITAQELPELSEDDKDKVNPRSETLHILTKDERGFIAYYRTLSKEQKKELKEYMMNM